MNLIKYCKICKKDDELEECDTKPNEPLTMYCKRCNDYTTVFDFMP